MKVQGQVKCALFGQPPPGEKLVRRKSMATGNKADRHTGLARLCDDGQLFGWRASTASLRTRQNLRL